MTNSNNHNAAMLPLLRMIAEHAHTEEQQWVILESLCLGIGLLHNRDSQGIATFIETMAERIATGDREMVA